MISKKYYTAFALLLLISGCTDKDSLRISVTNQTDISVSDIFISIELNSLPDSFTIYDDENEIHYQILNLYGNQKLGFVLDLNSNERKLLEIKSGNRSESEFKSRTYAELAMKPGNVYIDGKFRGNKFINVTKLKVPGIHTDHDALFKYEGPGWESEKVGYRFYLDWRNANDIFGKKINELVLSGVGVHDTVAKDDSYHQMQDWGMDIFKVGSSLGIGSIGMWSDNRVNMVSKTDSIFCEIVENGPVRSAVKTSYFGWQVVNNKYDLISTVSITAGSRLTRCELDISGYPENIVTGLAKFEGTDFITDTENSEWNYIALYGNQTLADPDDKLGIAVFFRSQNLIEITADNLSHIVKLKPASGKVEYYFCAAWEQEPGGIKTKEEFVKYLGQTLIALNNPPIVKIN